MRLNIKAEIADTGFRKLRGLMFRRSFNDALLFRLGKETRLEASIHSFFVFFSFDVLWLDKSMKVIDLRGKVIPFTFILVPRKKCSYILELPEGYINKYGIKLGEKIELGKVKTS